jgi:putative ABC transport system substrate-binding protein
MSTRREFITLLGGAAAAWPLAARAQQPKLPKIGVLVTSAPEPFWSQFREGLGANGYIEGRNVQFEFRSADRKPDLLRVLADELVRLKVDIIVASLTPAVIAAKQATSEIPIVMVPAGDPVRTGLISSLARPGGNVTGLSSTTAAVYVKTLELIREVLPSTQRVAVLANSAIAETHLQYLSSSKSRMPVVRSASQSRRLGSAARRSSTRPLRPWTRSEQMRSWCRGVSRASPLLISRSNIVCRSSGASC